MNHLVDKKSPRPEVFDLRFAEAEPLLEIVIVRLPGRGDMDVPPGFVNSPSPSVLQDLKIRFDHGFASLLPARQPSLQAFLNPREKVGPFLCLVL